MAADPYITTHSQTYSDFGLAQSKLWPKNTLCITIAGANTARTAILKFEACFPDSVVGFLPDASKADIHFVKYSIDLMKDRFLGVTRGTTQDNLSLDKLLSFPILTPPLHIQRCIGRILAAYDDLIENNSRRIDALERMIGLVYDEWFERFRFPETDGLSAPNKWPRGTLGDVVRIHRGRSYKGEDLCDADDGVPFVNLKCMNRDGGFRRDGLKGYRGDFKPEHQVRPGDIVVAVTDMTQERRIVARAATIPPLNTEFGVISMDLVRIAPGNEVNRSFLYRFLRHSRFPDEVKNHANGANVLHLSPELIERYAVRLPPKALQERFASIIGPYDQLRESLQQINDRLRRTRELLLPRLISGDLDVSRMFSVAA
jgi:type I restriction enzyme S subunit